MGDAPRPTWRNGVQGDFDYAGDVRESCKLIESALQRLDQPRLIEVACGMYPLTAQLQAKPAEHVAMDLCFPELQLAALHHRRAGPVAQGIQFFCGDVEALPFPDGAFNCAVICAALHHFPDPVAALRAVRKALAPNGLLVVVREPCHVNVHHVDYREQLRLGFNEQQFQPEEYAAIFDAAGFDILEGQIDFGGSLKAVLRRR